MDAAATTIGTAFSECIPRGKNAALDAGGIEGDFKEDPFLHSNDAIDDKKEADDFRRKAFNTLGE